MKKKIYDIGYEAFPRGNCRRSRNEIVFDILTEALSGVNKTRLIYRCNLNLVRFSRYLRKLLDAGLLECIKANPEGVVLYRTTVKGHELLRILCKANEFLPT